MLLDNQLIGSMEQCFNQRSAIKPTHKVQRLFLSNHQFHKVSMEYQFLAGGSIALLALELAFNAMTKVCRNFEYGHVSKVSYF